MVSRRHHIIRLISVASIALTQGSEAFLLPRRAHAGAGSSTAIFLNLQSPHALFPNSVYETIQNGQIAVIPEFLDASLLGPLKRDASYLYANHFFSTDALAGYGADGHFDPARDRAVLKLPQWKNDSLGDATVRHQLAAVLQDVRTDLAHHLNRPRLLEGASVSQYGPGSTEISYTRFGPGAYLQRHIDEHHEELKGPAGWSTPTRRSLSWLIYFNEKWNVDRSGGALRCYERAVQPPSHRVGARGSGDLQIGWLRATMEDPVERPVFLNAQYRGDSSSSGANCALFVDDSTDSTGIRYISKPFHANPTLFVAGSEYLVQQLWMKRRNDAPRFHLLEPPKSRITDWWTALKRNHDDAKNEEECPVEVPPLAGTLVVFDSVSLPHEVLPTVDRERWAASGWMHEDQQHVETHPDYIHSSSIEV